MEKDEVWRKTYADIQFLLPELPYEAVQRPQAGIFNSPKRTTCLSEREREREREKK